MVTAMNRIERHAAFYRGYLADDRNLTAVVAVLLMGIAFWLFFYLISAVGPQSDRRAASVRHASTFGSSEPTRR